MATKATLSAVIKAAKAKFLKVWGFNPRSRCDLVEVIEKSSTTFHVEISKWDGGKDGNRVWDFFLVKLVVPGTTVASRLY